jgi:hypothetical protein
MSKLALVCLMLIRTIAFNLGTDCRFPFSNDERIGWLADLVNRSQEILKRYKRPSWIAQGTLLGSVRDRRILPWTGDADVQLFDHDMADICNASSGIYKAFRSENLTVFDCQDRFLRVCLANVNNEPRHAFAEADRYSPMAILELYGCSKRGDGLYDIKDWPCRWNFSQLFPLRTYPLSPTITAWGPGEPTYFLEHSYGPNWSTPVYYSGSLTLKNICHGKIKK